ncbi:MAG TPA: hypothetical protein VHB49_14275 [Bradyrhizobium sp.]|nr:hypothetical protein [Bradyrhizobium sp.]
MTIDSERFDDVILGLEIEIDRTVAEAGSLHDVGHAGLMKTILRKTGEGSIQDLMLAGVTLGLADFRHLNKTD